MKMIFNKRHRYRLFLLSIPILSLLSSCGGVQTPVQVNDSKPQVIATTSILGDVVEAVGGDAISLDFLIPIDADPHSYEPVPRDVAMLSEADAVFTVGLGYESFLDPLLKNIDPAKVIPVSSGIQTRSLSEDESPGVDPHVWFNPQNVAIWADQIAETLTTLDPSNGPRYQANAEAYRTELSELDDWAREQIETIPEDSRILVADHDAFGYFADHYGFLQVGTVVPGFSTMAEPSALDLASLEETIKDLGVRAIFVGTSANPVLSERIARDTGVKLVPVYTESLSNDGGDAPHYLDFFRYNVNAIVETLK